MSSIFSFFEHLFSSTAHPPTQISVKPHNYLNSTLTSDEIKAATGTLAEANKHYVRIWVTRMLLAENMQWLATVYPAVYSAVHLNFGDTDVDLTNIAGPKQLGNLKPADQDHSLAVNQAMTGLLPFRGGTVQLSCGLTSMPASNLLANFLNTVGDFASKLVQPQVSAGIALASTVATGVQSLLGAGQAKLVLYYGTEFTGNRGEQMLQSGFVFLSDAPSGSIPPEQLWVIDGEPRIGSTATNARAVQGQNYVLIQLEVRTDRDDWQQFKEIQVPLQQAIDAKIQGKADDAQKFLVAARLAAWNSQDLTDADRTRVITAITAEYSNVPDQIQKGLVQASAVSLAEVMKGAMSVDVALERGLPSAKELLETA
jgi:hypothetical protein